MTEPALSGIDAQLRLIKEMLAADGFRLKTALEEGRLVVSITAGPKACGECLIPKDMMKLLIARALVFHGELPVDIHYPTDSPN